MSDCTHRAAVCESCGKWLGDQLKDSGPGGGAASPPAAAGAGLTSGPGEGNQSEGNPAGPGIPIAEHAALQDQLLGEIAAHQALDGQVALLLRRLRQRNETIRELSKGKIELGDDDRPPTTAARLYHGFWRASILERDRLERELIAVCKSHQATNKGNDRLTRQLEKLGRRIGVLRAMARYWQRQEEAIRYTTRVTLNAYRRNQRLLLLERDALRVLAETLMKGSQFER